MVGKMYRKQDEKDAAEGKRKQDERDAAEGEWQGESWESEDKASWRQQLWLEVAEEGSNLLCCYMLGQA